MRLLLTGATGFLGSRAVAVLRERHTVVTLPSALVRGDLTPARLDALRAAIADAAPDALVHTAAIADMGYAEQHPDESEQANVALPLALARLCAAQGCRLVHCSSDQVYNGCEGSVPFAEDVPLAPRNLYGRQKLASETLVLDAAPDSVCLRLSWMYDLPGWGLPTHANLITNLFKAAARKQPLSLYATDLRGITYARAVAERLPAACALPGGAYNFGSESTGSVWQTGVRWCEVLGLPPETVQPAQGTPRSLCMDGARLQAQGIAFDDTAEGITRLAQDYGLLGL